MDKLKNLLKKKLRNITFKLILSKAFVLILIILIAIFIFVPLIHLIIDLETAIYKDKDESNVPFKVSEFIKTVKFDEKNGIYFETTDSLGNKKIASAEDLWDMLIQNGSNVDKFLDNYEELEKLIDAEVITQYPHIGVGEGKLDGTIKFERNNANNKKESLQYVNINTFNEYVNNTDDRALKYFSMDDDGNVLIAVKEQRKEVLTTDDPNVDISQYSQGLSGSNLNENGNYSSETITIEKFAPINYKSIVQKYTMPFQFLWSLCVTSQDKDFVLELADLVKNSEIVISIYDNETTTVTTDKFTYDKTIMVEKPKESSEDSDGSDSETEYEEVTVTYTVTDQVTSIVDTPEVALTKANVWIVDYEKGYKYQTENTKSSEDNNNGGQTSTTTSSTKKYVAQAPDTTPKVDKKSKEPNFVSILSKPEYYNAQKNIVSIAEELFTMLEKNPDTTNMVDLMKYLLHMVTGNTWDGIEDYEFSAYEPTSFEVATESASDILMEYIHKFENASGPPTSADSKRYIIEDDGFGHPTVGYGVDIYNGGYTDLFKKSGYSLNIGDEIDKDFVDSIEAMEMRGKTSGMTKQLAGLNLTEYQMNAMISRAYNCGENGAIKERNGKTFVQAYKAYWDESRDDKFPKKDSNADFSHKLYTTYMNIPITSNGEVARGLVTRRESEWTLFQTGYYSTLKKWHSEGGSIIEAAEKIHSYMEQNKYTYCVYGGNGYEECNGGGHGLNATFEASKTGYHHACCATYVSWVLQEAGYLSASEHSNSANDIRTIMERKGFQRISNKSDLQPGDVLCYDHHVEIYAGNNKIYNAGSGNSIRNSAPSNLTRSFYYALRPIKK